MNIKKLLFNQLDKEENKDSDEFTDNIWDVLYSLSGTKDWPDVADEDGVMESLDTENIECVSLTDDEVVIHCGGDWQPAERVVIKADDSGLYVHSHEPVEEWKEGLSGEELYEIYKNYDDTKA